MLATLDYLIANEPGKTASIPYKIHVPESSLLHRISRQIYHSISTRNETSNIKDDSTPMESIQARDLCVSGTRIWDIEYYRILGNVFTYKHQKSDESPLSSRLWIADSSLSPASPSTPMRTTTARLKVGPADINRPTTAYPRRKAPRQPTVPPVLQYH